jgi:hypothetical protein
MTYDAVLVARRGLGPAELRLARPAFLRAVRWALYAEQLSGDLPEIRTAVATDPPDSLTGADLIRFMANRKSLREGLAETEGALYPPDEDGDG